MIDLDRLSDQQLKRLEAEFKRICTGGTRLPIGIVQRVMRRPPSAVRHGVVEPSERRASALPCKTKTTDE